MKSLFEFLNNKRLQNRWFKLALIYAAWTLPAILFASQTALSLKSAGRPISWFAAYCDQLVYCFIWASATPLIMYFARRYPIERPFVGSRLALHFGISLVISIAQRIVYSLYSFAFPIIPALRYR